MFVNVLHFYIVYLLIYCIFTSFAVLRNNGSASEVGKLPPRPPSKFFKSRNPVPVCEETIEEEDEDEEEEEEDAWMSMDKENVSSTNASKNQSVDGSLEQTVVPRGTSTHLRVGVRLRPGGSDVAGGVSVDGDQVIVKGRVFPVSCVLGEDASQEEVYNKMVRPQVAQLGDDEACNSILFAYGPTGTGKTYTMGTGDCLVSTILVVKQLTHCNF